MASMSSIFKSQIDWIPLAGGAIRATQGKTLALMQVSGGSQSEPVPGLSESQYSERLSPMTKIKIYP